MILFRRENISVLIVVTYRIVQSCALVMPDKDRIQPACINEHAIKGKNGTRNGFRHKSKCPRPAPKRGQLHPE
jgi:hypothetical protein